MGENFRVRKADNFSPLAGKGRQLIAEKDAGPMISQALRE